MRTAYHMAPSSAELIGQPRSILQRSPDCSITLYFPNHVSRFTFHTGMTHKRNTILLAELRESFSMAMGALTAHKLRSGLTLLGVLVGVFSIIVVMTAMRVMKSDIEKEISQLGGQTFMVRKWPGIYFGGPDGFEKYWRRKNITYPQGLQVHEKATLATAVGIESTFWGGQVETRY